MGLIIAPWFSANVSVDERVDSLQIWVLTVVCTFMPSRSSEYPPFFKSLENLLEYAPTGDSNALLGDFNTHVGNASET